MGGSRPRPIGHPRLWLAVHAVATVAWPLMAIPALLFWRDSVTAVILTSLYANAVAHLAAWQAVRAEIEAARHNSSDGDRGG